jgi:hypothetical protein
MKETTRYHTFWDREQDAQLRAMRSDRGMNVRMICEQMGRSYKAVKWRLRLLESGNEPHYAYRRFYTKEDDQLLLTVTPENITEIAARLDRTTQSVRQRMEYLGLYTPAKQYRVFKEARIEAPEPEEPEVKPVTLPLVRAIAHIKSPLWVMKGAET